MNTMMQKTNQDRLMIAMTVVPLGGLIAMLAWSATSWQMGASRIRPALAAQFGEEVASAPSPVAVVYEQRTSADQSRELDELLDAIEDLDERYGSLLSISESHDEYLKEDEQKVVDTFIQQYAEEAKPIIAAFDNIDFTGKPIWVPWEHDRPYSYANGVYRLRSIAQMFRLDMIAAAQSGDTDRVVQSFERVCTVFRQPLPPDYVVCESVRTMGFETLFDALRLSLPRATWSAEQLDAIDKSLQRAFSYKESWRRAVRATQLLHARWLLGQPHPDLSHQEMLREVTFAPSTRLAWFQLYDQLALIANDDPVELQRDYDLALHEYAGQDSLAMDSLTQYPFADPMAEIQVTSVNWLASTYMSVENNRRHARTAVAILRYKQQFDSLPEKLSELEKLDYPVTESAAIDGQPFAWERMGDVMELWNRGLASGNDDRQVINGSMYTIYDREVTFK